MCTFMELERWHSIQSFLIVDNYFECQQHLFWTGLNISSSAISGAEVQIIIITTNIPYHFNHFSVPKETFMPLLNHVISLTNNIVTDMCSV